MARLNLNAQSSPVIDTKNESSSAESPQDKSVDLFLGDRLNKLNLSPIFSNNGGVQTDTTPKSTRRICTHGDSTPSWKKPLSEVINLETPEDSDLPQSIVPLTYPFQPLISVNISQQQLAKSSQPLYPPLTNQYPANLLIPSVSAQKHGPKSKFFQQIATMKDKNKRDEVQFGKTSTILSPLSNVKVQKPISRPTSSSNIPKAPFGQHNTYNDILPTNSAAWNTKFLSNSQPVKVQIPKNDSPTWTQSRDQKSPITKLDSPPDMGHGLFTVSEAEKHIKELFAGNVINEEEEAGERSKSVEGLNVELMDHQIDGLTFLRNRESGKSKGGILADDMGLGKTVQILALILANPSPSKKQPTLVVVPLSLLDQWHREISTKTNLTVLKHHGTKRATSGEGIRKHDIIVTTYDIIRSEWNGLEYTEKNKDDEFGIGCFKVVWHRIVLDEAQIIKNRSSKAARAVCALDSRNKWCLTGTPIQNSVDELYSLIKFLRIQPFSDFSQWKERISQPMKSGHGDKAIKRLHAFLGKILLRRTKEYLTLTGNKQLKLPQRKIINDICDFSAVEREFYSRLEATANKTLDELVHQAEERGKGNMLNMLCLLLRLRQATVHWELVAQKLDMKLAVSAGDSVGKKEQAEEIDDVAALLSGLGIEEQATRRCDICLTELSVTDTPNGKNLCFECQEQGRSITNHKSIITSTKVRRMLEILTTRDESDRKTIVFSQFTQMFNLIEPMLDGAGIGYARYEGSMPNSKREESLRKLREDNKTRVLLCSLKCGSLGLTLTSASRVILLDVWWNPAVENQAIDRVHRIGQMRDVVVHKITIKDTVEERIVAMQEKKKAIAMQALGDSKGGKMISNKLSWSEALALFGRDG